jgi:nitrogenase molybdenum-iron protein alpha chain
MQDENIVFGGEKKLMEAIREAYELFKPKAISVFSTCPIGLIGDDVHQVAKAAREERGINVFGFSCEGYRGVSQSAGHHIANNGLLRHVVGRNDNGPEGEFKINLLGEYNIGGDAFVLEDMFEELGITLISTFSGNSTISTFEQSHTADLNLVMCHRSINYIAEMMETKYGIPWFKVNFIGAEATAKALRKVGDYFEDKALSDRIEKYIKEKLKMVDNVVKEVKKITSGKLAAICRRFQGASLSGAFR